MNLCKFLSIILKYCKTALKEFLHNIHSISKYFPQNLNYIFLPRNYPIMTSIPEKKIHSSSKKREDPSNSSCIVSSYPSHDTCVLYRHSRSMNLSHITHAFWLWPRLPGCVVIFRGQEITDQNIHFFYGAKKRTRENRSTREGIIGITALAKTRWQGFTMPWNIIRS